MRKNFTSLLFLFFLFVCLVISSGVVSQSNSKIEYVEVENLFLDETKVLTWCPYADNDKSVSGCHRDNLKINVFTATKYTEKSDLTYYYLVDGGIIVGEGNRVVWDLFRTKPGKYSITVGIGKDSIIKGNTITKTIEVKTCPACTLPCACPVLEVLGPQNAIKAGDAVIVTAKVTGGTQENVRYNWTLTESSSQNFITSKAIIEAGQSTKQIIVRTDKSMKGHKITATVELGGVCAECSPVASILIEVADN